MRSSSAEDQGGMLQQAPTHGHITLPMQPLGGGVTHPAGTLRTEAVRQATLSGYRS